MSRFLLGVLLFSSFGLTVSSSVYGWGLVIPRVEDRTTIYRPEKGELVYDTTSESVFVNVGTADSENWKDLTEGTSTVYNPESGGVAMVSAKITNSGSPIVANQDGSWISGVTPNTTGDFTLNLSSTVFETAPNCTCTAMLNNRNCDIGGTSTSAISNIRTHVADSGSGTNVDVMIICVGPKYIP